MEAIKFGKIELTKEEVKKMIHQERPLRNPLFYIILMDKHRKDDLEYFKNYFMKRVFRTRKKYIIFNLNGTSQLVPRVEIMELLRQEYPDFKTSYKKKE